MLKSLKQDKSVTGKSVNLHACVPFGKFSTSGKQELMNPQNLIN